MLASSCSLAERLLKAGLALQVQGAIALQVRVELGEAQGDLGLLLAQDGLALLGGPSQGRELQEAGGGGAQLELPYLGAQGLVLLGLAGLPVEGLELLSQLLDDVGDP